MYCYAHSRFSIITMEYATVTKSIRFCLYFVLQDDFFIFLKALLPFHLPVHMSCWEKWHIHQKSELPASFFCLIAIKLLIKISDLGVSCQYDADGSTNPKLTAGYEPTASTNSGSEGSSRPKMAQQTHSTLMAFTSPSTHPELLPTQCFKWKEIAAKRLM